MISTNDSYRIQYNSSGNRLLFSEDYKGPQVVDLPTFLSGNEDEGKKNLATGSGDEQKHKGYFWTENHICFDGANDELVVAVSNENDFHVWSIPEGRFDDPTTGGAIDVEHLMRFPALHYGINGLCFRKDALH